MQKGLKPGETVVTEGQLRLEPGSRVTTDLSGRGGAADAAVAADAAARGGAAAAPVAATGATGATRRERRRTAAPGDSSSRQSPVVSRWTPVGSGFSRTRSHRERL